MKVDGSVVTWGRAGAGGDSSGVSAQLSEGVQTVVGNEYAFAAVKVDGSVVTWGGSTSSCAVVLSLGFGARRTYSRRQPGATRLPAATRVVWQRS